MKRIIFSLLVLSANYGQAQSYNEDANTSGNFLLMIIVTLVALFLYTILLRAIFQVPKLIRLQKTQVRLLEKMAERQGVSQSDLFKIMYEVQEDIKLK